MSLSQNSYRILSLFLALNLALLTTVIVPTANAATGGRYYQAELTETAKKDQKIIRGTMIRCKETNCRGKKTGSSNASMCSKIAQTFGRVKSFSVGDKVFDTVALKKCNKKAK